MSLPSCQENSWLCLIIAHAGILSGASPKGYLEPIALFLIHYLRTIDAVTLLPSFRLSADGYDR